MNHDDENPMFDEGWVPLPLDADDLEFLGDDEPINFDECYERLDELVVRIANGPEDFSSVMTEWGGADVIITSPAKAKTCRQLTTDYVVSSAWPSDAAWLLCYLRDNLPLVIYQFGKEPFYGMTAEALDAYQNEVGSAATKKDALLAMTRTAYGIVEFVERATALTERFNGVVPEQERLKVNLRRYVDVPDLQNWLVTRRGLRAGSRSIAASFFTT